MFKCIKFYLAIGIMLAALLLAACSHADEPLVEQASPPSPRHSFGRPGNPNFMIASDRIIAINVEASPTGITFYAKNMTDNWMDYNAIWNLAKWAEGVWQPVPFAQELDSQHVAVVPDIGYILPANDYGRNEIVWDWLFGELAYGRFMFFREFFCRESGDSEILMIEFVIGD